MSAGDGRRRDVPLLRHVRKPVISAPSLAAFSSGTIAKSTPFPRGASSNRWVHSRRRLSDWALASNHDRLLIAITVDFLEQSHSQLSWPTRRQHHEFCLG